MKLHKSEKQRIFFKFLAVFCTVVFLCVSVFAKTPAEYRETIESVNDLINDLHLAEAEDFSTLAGYQAFERETISRIRQNLPVAENIEWQGATVETENRWLFDKLDSYQTESANLAKRKMILTEISERLEAVKSKLDELENSGALSRTKDEDKQKLAEILKREEYAKPEKPEESWLQSLIRRFLAWLNENAPQDAPDEPARAGYPSFSVVLMLALFALVLALIGFLFYKFAPRAGLSFRSQKGEKNRDRVILGERLAANESADSLFTEAERLALEGNLRQAIRKGYIALLCELSDRKIINLARHKTNRDYLREARKHSALYQNMQNLTDNFERRWYGFENTAEKDWNEFRARYKKALGENA
jgi:hypothetical protein